MKKFAALALGIGGLVWLNTAASAKTEPYSSMSAGDLKFECTNTGGTYGEVIDSKSGQLYYWCKRRGGGIIKCVNKNCTVTTPILAKTPVIGAGGNSRDPGKAAPDSHAGTGTKAGVKAPAANTKASAALASPPPPNAVGIAKPVVIPGPAPNNNKRQQQ